MNKDKNMEQRAPSQQVLEPHQIIKVSSSRADHPQFLHENLKRIVSNELSRDLPFFVVSITGEPRSGKSFLLNLMVTYLQNLAENLSDDGWEKSECEIRGGRWAMSSRTVTHGIWMWNQPFVINVNDRKVAVLLVDCGSAENGQGDPDLDLLIQYMSLQLCNVQILNVRSILKSTDLDKIWTCVNYSHYASDGETVSMPDSFLFVMRNWEADDKLGKRDRMFSEMMKNTRSDEMRKCYEAIDAAFKYKTCYTLPHPGQRTTGSSDHAMEYGVSGLTVAALNEDFAKIAKELFLSIVAGKYYRISETSSAALLNENGILENFKALEERVRTHKLESFTRSAIEEEKTIRTAYVSNRDLFDESIEKLLNNLEVRTAQTLNRRIDSTISETRRQFEENPLLSSYKFGATKRKYCEKLERKFHLVYTRSDYISRLEKLQWFSNTPQSFLPPCSCCSQMVTGIERSTRCKKCCQTLCCSPCFEKYNGFFPCLGAFGRAFRRILMSIFSCFEPCPANIELTYPYV